MDDSMSDWWAVQVRAARETVTSKHLRLRGYNVFLPYYFERRRWSDRVKTYQRPLFPGYVFCQLTRSRLGKVITAPGVIRVVGNSCGPMPIPHSQIDAVWRLVKTRLEVSPWPFIRVGQAVRVEAGPLRGTEGIVVGTKNKRRLIVSVPLLQRSVAVELDANCVRVPLSTLVADELCSSLPALGDNELE